MKKIILFTLLTCSLSAMSQKYFYLEDIKLKTEADFINNEKNVIKAVHHLLKTSIYKNNLDREVCIRFLLNYAMETPFATIQINSYVGDLYAKNKDFLGMYIGIWLKETIEKKGETDEYYQIKTLEALYNYSKKGNGVKKTKFIKDLIQAGDNKNIESFFKEINN